VFILASAPVETLDNHAHMYEMDEPYPTAMHQDLKRGLELGRKQSGNDSSNNNMQDGLPLFEKYQFLSPGKSNVSLRTSASNGWLIQHRYFHGSRCQSSAPRNTLGRRIRHREPRGILYGVQQGNGPECSE
jgi:hypothetical protein